MNQLLYVGIKGRVLAINRSSGEIAWETKLKGGQMVTLIVEGKQVFASTSGEVFCVDASTGMLVWQNSLPGMGLSLASIATATANSGSILQQETLKRAQQSAAAA